MSLRPQSINEPHITQDCDNNFIVQSQRSENIHLFHNAFTICKSCFWCATTNEGSSFCKCPVCKKSKVDNIPLLGTAAKCNLDTIETILIDKRQ